MISEKLKDLIKNLPDMPGVYLMKNKDEKVIYVGKAISLKNRVKQYFQSSRNMDAKVRAMVSHIDEFEYIVTDSEMEALILENNLIKEYKPQYNILLRDDKTYPYIKVTLKEYFPRVIKVRKVEKDGAKYFGPYTNAFTVNETLDAIREIFPIRTCKRDIKKSIERRERPCLNLYIKKCVGPCTGKVDEKAYMEMIDEIIDFLGGKNTELIEKMKQRMMDYSGKFEFEEAARIRDRIKNIESMFEKQKIVYVSDIDQDFIGMAREEDLSCIQVFFVRNGKVVGREHFFFEKTKDSSSEEIISSFIKQFYMNVNLVPKEIIVDTEFEDMEVMSAWLTEKKSQRVDIRVPVKGAKKKLLELVEKNALETIRQKSNIKIAKLERTVGVMKELQEFLNLEKLPKRIEAFDISNIQGVDSVGGQVVFIDGEKAKKEYRRYKVKSVEGPNDYASLEEILRRRLKHENHPDLILMDGGKGQVSVAKKVLKEEGLDIPVLGMYKDSRHRTLGITTDKVETELSKHSLIYKFIASVQEEVHRFAISYHRSLRQKALEKSELDEIKGIGKKRKMALISHFKSINKIKNATIEELTLVEGMDKKSANAVFSHFREDESLED
ncbi:excinuclease ABC subunit C [Acetoanaerobium pronyense]|uniref:UvrABC system protein C n=1 Tax=Acetoanaerobium pronyense TaxID=1482736 RepID=A0ABS4KGH0_9FIRM|nr:excinuclease ABC subunit UvrC [Acetoanaerobium pronyense]MBP2026879.1 excinuclease ABC subunit C [Acetoanaerobium pronyense]